MKKILSVDDLIVGMYVVRVTKSSGDATMKSKGVIKSESALKHLRTLAVKEVEVDLAKSEGDITKKADAEYQTTNDTISDDDEKTHSPSAQEMVRARDLYVRARNLQRESFDKLQNNGTLETGPYEEVATQFFDSIFQNKDALLCMTKLQDKDAYLFEHSINVAILLAIFSNFIGLNRAIGVKLTLAGLLHDIGKVKISDDVLFKNGKLTDKEFDHMKTHATLGADILSNSGLEGLAVQVALQHHERLSGSGYPSGLIAHQLNQYVRMASIADVFDAITAERVYKSAVPAIQAFKIIKQSGEQEFDVKLLNQFIRAIGLFSIGTIVLLKSQKLAVVTKANHETPQKPTVVAFYHTQYKRHIEPQTLDLKKKKANDTIEKDVNAKDYDIDVNGIIERFIINA